LGVCLGDIDVIGQTVGLLRENCEFNAGCTTQTMPDQVFLQVASLVHWTVRQRKKLGRRSASWRFQNGHQLLAAPARGSGGEIKESESYGGATITRVSFSGKWGSLSAWFSVVGNRNGTRI
jgi:hypothetical protein